MRHVDTFTSQEKLNLTIPVRLTLIATLCQTYISRLLTDTLRFEIRRVSGGLALFARDCLFFARNVVDIKRSCVLCWK